MQLPLDRDDIEAAARGFGSSFGLPGAAYTSEEVLDWERRHLFEPSWWCVGRKDAVDQRPGMRDLLGWSFVQEDASGPSFEDQFGNLAEHLAPYDPGSLLVGASKFYELKANWKLVHENYQECYHCSQIHPALCRVTPPDSGYSIDIRGMYVAGPMDLVEEAETMSLDGRSGGEPLPGLSGRHLREVGYFGIWPNLLVSTLPDYVLTHRLEPVRPDLTLVHCEWLFQRDVAEREGFDPSWAVDFWDVTNLEDWRACESLQRGAASRGFRPGPLSTAWEAGVYLWVKMVAEGYLSGSVPPPPSTPARATLPRYEALANVRRDG
jgi:glycine betaine catabolism A